MEEEIETRLRELHASLVNHGLDVRAREEVLTHVMNVVQVSARAIAARVEKAIAEGRI